MGVATSTQRHQKKEKSLHGRDELKHNNHLHHYYYGYYYRLLFLRLSAKPLYVILVSLLGEEKALPSSIALFCR